MQKRIKRIRWNFTKSTKEEYGKEISLMPKMLSENFPRNRQKVIKVSWEVGNKKGAVGCTKRPEAMGCAYP